MTVPASGGRPPRAAETYGVTIGIVSDRRQQGLEKAHTYLGQAKTLLGKASDAEAYQQVAIGVTLAYRQIEPLAPRSADIITFADALIDVGYTPGTNTTRIDCWVALTNEPWTRAQVTAQVDFMSELLEQLDGG